MEVVGIGRKPEDLTGKRFGDLTVLRIDESVEGKTGRHKKWICQCTCGEIASVYSHKLKDGVRQTCGKHKETGTLGKMSSKEKAQYMRQLQSMPLEAKVARTKSVIRNFYDHYDGNVNVSFSGGKDSTVLLDIARSIYPDIKATFVNTGVEIPETVRFVKTFDNVDVLRPKKSFMNTIKEYGYPIISKEVAGNIHSARIYFKNVADEIERAGGKPPVRVANGDYKKTLLLLRSWC